MYDGVFRKMKKRKDRQRVMLPRGHERLSPVRDMLNHEQASKQARGRLGQKVGRRGPVHRSLEMLEIASRLALVGA